MAEILTAHWFFPSKIIMQTSRIFAPLVTNSNWALLCLASSLMTVAGQQVGSEMKI